MRDIEPHLLILVERTRASRDFEEPMVIPILRETPRALQGELDLMKPVCRRNHLGVLNPVWPNVANRLDMMYRCGNDVPARVPERLDLIDTSLVELLALD